MKKILIIGFLGLVLGFFPTHWVQATALLGDSSRLESALDQGNPDIPTKNQNDFPTSPEMSRDLDGPGNDCDSSSQNSECQAAPVVLAPMSIPRQPIVWQLFLIPVMILLQRTWWLRYVRYE
jgi:hypothetical protein